jgi:hypothetical protein
MLKKGHLVVGLALGHSGFVACSTLLTCQELITEEASLSVVVLIVSVLACLFGRDGSHTDMCILVVDCSTMRRVHLQVFHILPDHIFSSSGHWIVVIHCRWQGCMSPFLPRHGHNSCSSSRLVSPPTDSASPLSSAPPPNPHRRRLLPPHWNFQNAKKFPFFLNFFYSPPVTAKFWIL